MMALSYHGYRFRKTMNGGNAAMLNVPLVAGTYYDGMPLRISATSGSAEACAAGGTTVAFILQGNVSTANSTSGKYPAYHVDDNNVFEGRMLASAAPQTRLADLAGIAVGTTYNYRLAGTAGPFRIVGFHPDESLSAHANCRFYFTGARSQLLGWAKLSTE